MRWVCWRMVQCWSYLNTASSSLISHCSLKSSLWSSSFVIFHCRPSECHTQRPTFETLPPALKYLILWSVSFPFSRSHFDFLIKQEQGFPLRDVQAWCLNRSVQLFNTSYSQSTGSLPFVYDFQRCHQQLQTEIPLWSGLRIMWCNNKLLGYDAPTSNHFLTQQSAQVKHDVIFTSPTLGHTMSLELADLSGSQVELAEFPLSLTWTALSDRVHIWLFCVSGGTEGEQVFPLSRKLVDCESCHVMSELQSDFCAESSSLFSL